MVKVQRLFAKTNLKIRVCERSAAMKAPVGLLSDRTVLHQQDGGALPRQVPVCVKIGRVVDGCRLIKGCIKKWVHGSANGQPELSTVKEANVKNMEVSVLPSQKDNFLSQNHFGKSGYP